MTDSPLARAQEGDGRAFEELIAPYRRELHAHCYRILGSFQDAEDVLQETFVSVWQALDRFDGRALRAWLYRIATSRCLNYLRDSSRRPQRARAPQPRSPFVHASSSDDPWWLEPYPNTLIDETTPGPDARYDIRESIALAFVAGLQHLPVQQRAALVLRDVLGFSASEAAEMLDTTPASVNSALQRARTGFRPARDPDQVQLPRSEEASAVVGRFVDAFERRDLEDVVALLSEDAKLTMPPEPGMLRGRAVIADYYRSQVFWGQPFKVVPTGANHQPALAFYLPDPNTDLYRASAMLVLTVSGMQISAITRFGDRGLFSHFGLPRTLPKSF
jgi:RNA polymerase sigma-70 factor (ECF subfamily)